MKRTVESALQEAKNFKTKQEMRTSANSLYQYLHKMSLIDEACKHMDNGRRRYTDEEILEDAKKYSSSYEWQKNSNMYYAAKYIGKEFLEKCYEHMDMVTMWTPELVKQEALKYEYRIDFALHGKGAFNAARKFDILNDVCRHMRRKSSNIFKRESIVLYYICIDERYYKIGVTTTSIKKRFSGYISRIRVVSYTIFNSVNAGIKEEERIINAYKDHLIDFKLLNSGNSEIFTHDVLGLDV